MITEERLTQALKFLAETDSPAANLKTDVERQSFKLKRIKATIFIHSTGNIEQRKAIAETSQETIDQEDVYLTAISEHESVSNKRKTEILITEIWRSLNANRRVGNI